MRSFLAICLIAVAVALPTQRASAYGTDVHFNLTYVAARLAGIDHRDALWIALADESIDHNRTTSAYSGTIDTFFQFLGLHRYIWARNGERWQAYTDIGAPNSALDGVVSSTHYAEPAKARAALIARRDALWNSAVAAAIHVEPEGRATAIRADIALGVFLHYEQDFYGHRQFGPALDGQNWTPYGTFRGHSTEGYSPDYVALRTGLAHEMLASTYAYLQEWQQHRGAKAPDVRADTFTSLIAHMSAAYDPRAMQYPDHRFRPWFPAQRALNHELSVALMTENPPHQWGLLLPNANDLRYQLPYDQPTTALRDVEQHVGETNLDPQQIPFSRVLTGDLLRP